MVADRSTELPHEQREWTRLLDGDPHAVATARALTAAALHGHDLELSDDAILVTSELVTNAITHGRVPVSITVTLRAGSHPSLVIDVSDGSPDLPVQNLPGEIGHFGLWIAEELARVTVRPTRHGKIVRATFPLTSESTKLPSFRG
jgi:anti-sigma regulatory factor (Ser/Thr protein kinase)